MALKYHLNFFTLDISLTFVGYYKSMISLLSVLPCNLYKH